MVIFSKVTVWLLTYLSLFVDGQTAVTTRNTVHRANSSPVPAKVRAPFYKASTSCANFTRRSNSKHDTVTTEVFQPTIELRYGLSLYFGVLVASILIAQVFRMVRRFAYHEKNSIETNNFDAGGTISGGLLASAIVAQWTWAATLLQSSNLASKDGVSGALWYAAGAAIQILLFSIVAVQLRIRAPGAKTFLRVIFSRFGATTHKVYVGFALATNLIVTAMLMTGGSAVATALIKDCSVSLISTAVAAIVASYTTIGGMGAVFYVSYFCAAIILIIITYFAIYIFYISDEIIGTTPMIYKLISCLTGPEGNKNRAYNTMRSQAGFIFGLTNIVGNFGTVFVDQSYWQIAVAAKPKQVVYGYLVGGLVWFAVPFGMANAMGLGYLAIGSSEGRPLLRAEDQDSGLVPVAVAQRLLGMSGAFLMLLAVILAVVSTAAAEVGAVSSIIVHDLIQIYFKPYRLVDDINSCILCGRARGRMANPVDKCQCHSKSSCEDCANDDSARHACKLAIKPNYECPTHGGYRRYMDYLNQMKSWCLVICSFALVPLNILTDIAGIKLGWLYSFMGVVVGSAVIPICLSMFWTRLTSEGMIAGAVGGCIAALITWLGLTSRLENGFSYGFFYRNSGDDLTMLGGNLVALLGGGLICVIVSFFTKPPIDMHEIWDYTYDIDNPLYPWAETYQSELGLADGNQLDNRPTFQSVYSKFKILAWTANGIGTVITVIIVVVVPAAMLKAGVFNLTVFTNWVNMCMIWVSVAMIYVVMAPVVEEIQSAVTAFRLSKKQAELHAEIVSTGEHAEKRK